MENETCWCCVVSVDLHWWNRRGSQTAELGRCLYSKSVSLCRYHYLRLLFFSAHPLHFSVQWEHNYLYMEGEKIAALYVWYDWDTAYSRGKQPTLIIVKISKINLPWDWHRVWIFTDNLSPFSEIRAVYPFIILVMAAPKHMQLKSKIALICAVRIYLDFSFFLPSLLMTWKICYTQGWLFWPTPSSSLSFLLLWEGLTPVGLSALKSVE